jgi:hypothetical protein
MLRNEQWRATCVLARRRSCRPGRARRGEAGRLVGGERVRRGVVVLIFSTH